MSFITKKPMDYYFPEFLDLQGREFYEFYKKKRKKPAPGINNFNNFKRALGGFFMKVRENVFEAENGVYLESLFYVAYTKQDWLKYRTEDILKPFKKSKKRQTDFKLLLDTKDKWDMLFTRNDYTENLKSKNYQEKKDEVKYFTDINKQFFD